MALITPQDLTSSKSVLDFLLDFAKEKNNVQMREEILELLNQYESVVLEPDVSDKTILPYNRKDAYSILEYLKLQAEQLSDGKWTDFSDADIGTVFLKLMSYLADMNNFQTDKSVSELYLSTTTERASGILLGSLVGYEPRHFQSAKAKITLTNASGLEIPNGTLIPAFSVFTNSESTIKYCNLKSDYIYDNIAILDIYQGTPVSVNFTIDDISNLGRILLNDYNIGTNTVILKVNGVEYKKVNDVRFVTGELCFSVHTSTEKSLYIQLPSYWTDVISQGSVIEVRYLISSGDGGRVGKNIINKIEQLSSEFRNSIIVDSCTASSGGYNPETIDEMRNNIPLHTRTMDTIVTINDFEEVGSTVLGIADISALDYNDPSSGLKQPDDYYKVKLYVLPDADVYDGTDADLVKYRNTVLKQRVDWTVKDLENVADGVDTHSIKTMGNSLVLSNILSVYDIKDIVPCIDTGNEDTSFVIEEVTDVSSITDRIVCKLTKSNQDVTITFNSNWKNFVTDTDKLAIYFKKEQVLTEKGQALREYIDERRLTSLNVTYHDLDIVQPNIIVDVYMDKDDIRFKSCATQIKEFIFQKYSRKNLKIGEPIFASVIGADILNEFDFIRYCEVREPEEKIEVLPRGFIDVIPYYQDSQGNIIDKIIINMHDYKNRVI